MAEIVNRIVRARVKQLKPRVEIDRWFRSPLRYGWWLASVAAIVLLVAFRLHRANLAVIDRDQQLPLVLALSRLDLRHALTSVLQRQASPPGFGFFALPFHVVLRGLVGYRNAYLIAGIATMVVLATAVLTLSRSLDVSRRSPHELLVVGAVVNASPVLASLTEAFHPSDLLATAMCALGCSAVFRGRIALAVVALGLGLFTKQWVIIPIAVLVATDRAGRRWQLALGSLAVFGIGIAPFVVTNRADSFAALAAADVVRGAHSLVGHLPVTSDGVIRLEARVMPLAVVAVLCFWCWRRDTISRAQTISVMAAAFLMRSLLDPGGFLYYLAPGAAFLALVRPTWQWPAAVLIGSVTVGILYEPAHGYRVLAAAFAIAALSLAAVTACLWAAFHPLLNRPDGGRS